MRLVPDRLFVSVLTAIAMLSAPRWHVAASAVSTRFLGQSRCDGTPEAPTRLTVQVDGVRVIVSWRAPDGPCRPLSYVVEAGSEPGRSDYPFALVADATTTTLPNVNPGVYYVRVRASNDVGLSAPSNEVIATVGHSPCDGLPPQVRNVFATVDGTTVLVEWRRPVRAPTSYLVELVSRADASKVISRWTPTADPRLTVSAPAGMYLLHVRARNACGVGEPSETILEVGGHPGTPDVIVVPRTRERNTYFATVERLTNGHLIVVYYDSPEHVSPLGRISFVKSVDGGLTWSAPKVAVDSPLDDRDPSVMQTREGTLLLSYFSTSGATPTEVPGTYVVRSDDEGDTWSAPALVETTLAPSATSAKIVELENGELLIPIYGGTAGYARSAVVRSTDGGRTWPKRQESAITSTASHDVLEPAVANLGGGRLFAVMRTERSDGKMMVSRSFDGGRTWSEPSKGGVAAQAPDLVPLPAGPADSRSLVHAWGDMSRRFGDGRTTLMQIIDLPGSTAEPVYGDHHVIYNSNCDDAAVPSSVRLDKDRLFVVFYDACHGYIGGNFVDIDTLRR